LAVAFRGRRIKERVLQDPRGGKARSLPPFFCALCRPLQEPVFPWGFALPAPYIRYFLPVAFSSIPRPCIIIIMTIEELASSIDLAALSPITCGKDVEELARRALAYPFATLCVPPSHVALAAGLLEDSPIKVSTVIGFPLGYDITCVKALAAVKAVEDGAEELDMVMNQGAFHGGEFVLVEDEIRAVVEAAGGRAVKVIIECCYLNETRKARAVDIIVRAGAHFVKTSTGFGPGGATVEDVRILSRLSTGRISVKAAGGIKTLEDAMAMLRAGATRIGTSSGVEIVEALTA